MFCSDRWIEPIWSSSPSAFKGGKADGSILKPLFLWQLSLQSKCSLLCLGGENKVGWKIPLGLFQEVMVKEFFQKLESFPVSSLAGSAISPWLPTALQSRVHSRVQTIPKAALSHDSRALPFGLSLIMELSLAEVQPAWKSREGHIQLKPVGFVHLFLFFLYELLG